jgi:hypothetical protein
MSEITLFPITIDIPLVILTNTARITLPIPEMLQQAQLIQVSGSLSTLTSGTVTVEVRRKAGPLLATLNWSATGDQVVTGLTDIFDQPNAGIRFDVTSIGVGALNLYVTAWFASAM